MLKSQGMAEAAKPESFNPAGLRGGTVRGVVAAIAMAALVELISRATPVRADPRLFGILAVVYAAFSGGAAGAVVAIVLTAAYAGYFYSAIGPSPHSSDRIIYLLGVFFPASLVAAGMVIALRRQCDRRAAEELGRERGRGTAATREHADQLAREAALNQALIDSLPARIVVLDGSGAVLKTNRAWNEFAAAAARSSGDGAARSMTNSYLEACERDTGDPRIAAGIRDVLAGRRTEFLAEYPHDMPRAGDASAPRRWFLLTAVPLAGGHGAVVTHIDITQRHEAEEQLRRRAEDLSGSAASLKRSNEELDQFAYVTSHDLRAPLRGIANLSAWIEEDMGETFTPEAHQQMELLRGRVHRMEAMIDGILEYSRVGRVRGAPEQIDMAALLAETVDLVAPPADVTIEVQPGMPMVMGERLRLQQVFMNLIGNAIKHNDNRPRQVTIGWREAGEKHEFSVADNGPGIEPQYHDKIFVIFQTLQPRDKVEGTGVGLSLVKKIVENAGGRVWVDSQLGEGTTFRFTWPKRAREPWKTAG